MVSKSWPDGYEMYPAVQHQEYPEHLRRLLEYMAPLGVMWPPDWLGMMALTYWSALWQRVRIENLALNLWFLGIGPQGVGKNITSDELYRVVRDVGQLLVEDITSRKMTIVHEDEARHPQGKTETYRVA